jgi:hypothetical protein
MKEVGGWGILRIFDLHSSKARYELKVVLFHLWLVNVKTIRGFINFPLADLSHINPILWVILYTERSTYWFANKYSNIRSVSVPQPAGSLTGSKNSFALFNEILNISAYHGNPSAAFLKIFPLKRPRGEGGPAAIIPPPLPQPTAIWKAVVMLRLTKWWVSTAVIPLYVQWRLPIRLLRRFLNNYRNVIVSWAFRHLPVRI